VSQFRISIQNRNQTSAVWLASFLKYVTKNWLLFDFSVRHRISKPKQKNHSKHILQWQFFKQFFVCLAEKFAKSGNITQKIVSNFFQKVHNLYTLDKNLLWSCSLCFSPNAPFKRTMSRDFCFWFFCMNQFPPIPRVCH
jgi:hypothetical protein